MKDNTKKYLNKGGKFLGAWVGGISGATTGMGVGIIEYYSIF